MKTLSPRQYDIFLKFVRGAVKDFNCIFDTDFSVDPLPNSCGLCLYFPTKAERWGIKMADKARKAAKRGELTIEMREHVTAVFVHETRASGIAICAPNDSYNADIGLGIAYCRAVDEPIPDYVL
jgi:hypothetical protein